jgi:hypothetical protein
LGVVIAGPQDPKLCHRPRVRPITDETGITHEFPEIDLSEMNLDGEYPDEIVDTVDPENLGLDISKYFI